jgi:hypothetical protein
MSDHYARWRKAWGSITDNAYQHFARSINVLEPGLTELFDELTDDLNAAPRSRKLPSGPQTCLVFLVLMVVRVSRASGLSAEELASMVRAACDELQARAEQPGVASVLDTPQCITYAPPEALAELNGLAFTHTRGKA